MTKPNDFAFPMYDKYESVSEEGLTKREYFAAMAMQGVLASDTQNQVTEGNAAKAAILYADALINELNKQP